MLGERSPRSKRLIAVWVVPARRASWAWVRPWRTLTERMSSDAFTR